MVTKNDKFLVGVAPTLEAVRPEVENWPSPIQPTEQELSSLAVACSVTLRDLDVNRLIPDKDYAINVPETTTSDLLTI